MIFFRSLSLKILGYKRSTFGLNKTLFYGFAFTSSKYHFLLHLFGYKKNFLRSFFGTTKLSRTTFSLMTLSIMSLDSLKTLSITVSSARCHYTECRYAQCHVLLLLYCVIMLNIAMLRCRGAHSLGSRFVITPQELHSQHFLFLCNSRIGLIS